MYPILVQLRFAQACLKRETRHLELVLHFLKLLHLPTCWIQAVQLSLAQSLNAWIHLENISALIADPLEAPHPGNGHPVAQEKP